MSVFDGVVKSTFDKDIEARLEQLFTAHGVQPLEIPGDIAELGVFRGLGLFTWANLLEAYCIGNRTKTVYGFDNWRGFETIAPEDGGTDPRM
jgi:hypothetical protein